MKVAIMQPYFFPYIGYWQLLNAVDTFVIYDDVNYIKQGYINRNSILVNGSAQRITLEVIGASQNKLINQVKVGNNRKKLIKSIEYTYKKSTMFKDVFPVIEEILSYPEENLAKFIGRSITLIRDYLHINTRILYSSEIAIKPEITSQARIINICQNLKATQYINGIGGKALYNKDDFLKCDIKLNFMSTEVSSYPQFKNDFIPSLSIIDIMMFNSIKDIKEMLTCYELVE